MQEELFCKQEEKMLTQLKESHSHQKVAAEQVIELKDALKTAADTVRECHKTNIALASEKKVCTCLNVRCIADISITETDTVDVGTSDREHHTPR